MLLLTRGAVPLWAGILLSAVASFLLLLVERLGVRHLETLFAVLISIMVCGVWGARFEKGALGGVVLGGFVADDAMGWGLVQSGLWAVWGGRRAVSVPTNAPRDVCDCHTRKPHKTARNRKSNRPSLGWRVLPDVRGRAGAGGGGAAGLSGAGRAARKHRPGGTRLGARPDGGEGACTLAWPAPWRGLWEVLAGWLGWGRRLGSGAPSPLCKQTPVRGGGNAK